MGRGQAGGAGRKGKVGEGEMRNNECMAESMPVYCADVGRIKRLIIYHLCCHWLSLVTLIWRHYY